MRVLRGSVDDVVVGAGIVGLAAAWNLARAGRRVVVLERNLCADGASIRNFGMIWPIGQPRGHRRDLALRSRTLWRQVLLAAGIWHEPVGSIHLAYHDDEASVLEEFARDARSDGFACELIARSGVAARAPRANSAGLRVALWSPHELVVDPREVVARLPRWLASEYDVRVEFGAVVTGCDNGRVETSTGVWQCERTFLCTGDEVRTLFPVELAALGLRPCKLQMMRSQPVSWRLGPLLAAGLTLAHYEAFAHCPTRAALRQRFELELPEYVRLGIHVMVSQNASGELTIGDSHEYGNDRTPFDRVWIDKLILDYLQNFLDVTDVHVAERWHGNYVSNPSGAFCAIDLSPSVMALVGFGGAGMTLSFGAAEETLGRYGIPAAAGAGSPFTSR